MLGERPKTAEELNAELYEKVSTEFEEYKNNLLSMLMTIRTISDGTARKAVSSCSSAENSTARCLTKRILSNI